MKIFKIQKIEGFAYRINIYILGIKLSIKQNLNSKKIKKHAKICWDKIFKQSQNDNSIIIFDHALGGGIETFFYNYIETLHFPILRIQNNIKYPNHYKISFIDNDKSDKLEFFECGSENLFEKLRRLNTNEIIVNNLVGYYSVEETLSNINSLKKHCGCKLAVMIHDYYCICPTYTLVNNVDGKYCNYTFDLQKCCDCSNKLLIKSIEVNQNFDIYKWQNMWRGLLKNSDEIRTFCQSSQQIINEVYPEYSDKITLVPHKIKPFKKQVGILGNIDMIKGRNIIKEFLEFLDKNNHDDIQLIVIGKIYPEIKHKNLKLLGEYKRDMLAKIIKDNYIDIIFIPSICPETFSYTTAEAISLGYPVMCFDIGGQADQVKQYSKGVITSQNMEDIYKNIISY